MIYAFNLMTYENYSLLNANKKFLYEQIEYVAELRKEAAKQRSETQMSLETRAKIAPTWYVKGQVRGIRVCPVKNQRVLYYVSII